MPTAGWLRRVDLPIDAAGRSYIDPPNLDQILDQFLNWRGNVNGGGYTLSNVVLDAAIKGSAQTPWLSNIDAAGYYLHNLGRMGAQQSSVELYPATNPTAVNSMQLVVRENTANPDYGLSIGMIVLASAWRGAIQMTVAATPADLLLNPSGGNIGIGTTSPTAKLHIAATNVAGVDAVTGLFLDRQFGDVGDSMDIVFGGGAVNRCGRISCAAVGNGEAGLIFYAQTGAGDGYSNEVMRIQGNGNVGIGASSPVHRLSVVGPNYTYADGSSGSAIASIGRGTSVTDDALLFGCDSISATPHGWIQAIKVATAYRPLVLNGSGGGLVLSCPDGGGLPYSFIPNGCLYMFCSPTALSFVVRLNDGTTRSGQIALG